MRVAVLSIVLGLAVLTATQAAPSAREACMADYKKFCSDIAPGGGRIKQCLIAHKAQLSPDCQAALAAKAESKKH